MTTAPERGRGDVPGGEGARARGDLEAVLTPTLEPGERLVWSDRPHTGLWPPSRGSAVAAVAWLAIIGSAIAFVVVGPTPSAPPDPEGETVVRSLVALLGAPLTGAPVIALAVFFWVRRSQFMATLYAMTDRKRLIRIEKGRVHILQLEPATPVTTRARGNEEFGDVQVGAVVLRRVSYPLIVVETIRRGLAAS